MSQTENAGKLLKADLKFTKELFSALEAAQSQEGETIDNWIRYPTVYSVIQDIRQVPINGSKLVSSEIANEVMAELAVENQEIVADFISVFYSSNTAAEYLKELPKQ